MISKSIKTIVRHLPLITTLCFRGMAIFLVGDGLLHFAGVRIYGIAELYDPAIEAFVAFFQYIWASFVIFVGLLFFLIQKDLKKYLSLYPLIGSFLGLHGVLLIFLSSNHYEEILPLANMYVFNKYYTLEIIIEGLLLIVLGGVILSYYLMCAKNQARSGRDHSDA